MKDLKRQNRWVMVLAMGMILGLPLAGIAAYFVTGHVRVNPVTVGGSHIRIDEEFIPEPIVPGKRIRKKVSIHNEGPNACYVRARVLFSDSDMGQYSDIDWDLSDWIYDGSEEYYYYQKPIAPGEDTSCLMTGIYIQPDTPEDEIKNVDVIVYAESYQADGFQDYEEAWKDYSKNLKGDMLYE